MRRASDISYSILTRGHADVVSRACRRDDDESLYRAVRAVSDYRSEREGETCGQDVYVTEGAAVVVKPCVFCENDVR